VTQTIGFIGLGVMGKPMAKNLLKAGYPLVVHSRSRGPVDEVVGAGARAADSPAAVARDAEVVITMVPDTVDVEQVIGGPDGVLTTLQHDAIVIDMSSISPVATRRLSAAVSARGGWMLDAPVSGGDIGAINGTLSIMVGGDEAAFTRALPILSCMGSKDRIVYIGESGAGQICKICNQIAIGGALASVSEAFALARKAGVDPARVRAALAGGFAGSRVLDVHGGRILAGTYDPGFRTKLYQKDLRIANETAAATAVAIPATAVVTQLVNALVASGGGDLDCAAVAMVLFRMAGLSYVP
jgi:2-hydroxy-3-oxopropionate reductase